MRTIGHFIGGREVKGTSGRFADVFQPMTGDVQAQVALASKAELRAAVENAKAARKQAMAVLATLMGTLVLARVAGNGEFSDEILGAGRDAVLDRATPVKPARAKKSAPRKTAASAQH